MSDIHNVDFSGKYEVVSQGGFPDFLQAMGVSGLIAQMAIAMGKGALKSLSIEHQTTGHPRYFRTRTVTPLREMVANFQFDHVHEHETPVCLAVGVYVPNCARVQGTQLLLKEIDYPLAWQNYTSRYREA